MDFNQSGKYSKSENDVKNNSTQRDLNWMKKR